MTHWSNSARRGGWIVRCIRRLPKIRNLDGCSALGIYDCLRCCARAQRNEFLGEPSGGHCGRAIARLRGGAIADWFLFLRKKFPDTPNLFPAVFVSVFLLVAGVGVLETVLSPNWYSSTVRLRLGLASMGRAGHGAPPGSSAVYDAQLIKTESDFIRSEEILRPVITDLDLSEQWGKRYSGGMNNTPLSTKETIAHLKERIEVRRIPDTCLIEICVQSDKPQEAASLANALGETYRDHKRDHPAASPQGPAAIRAEVLDHACARGQPQGAPRIAPTCFLRLSRTVFSLRGRRQSHVGSGRDPGSA